MNYTPPYTITSKMVHLISSISEELTKIENTKKENVPLTVPKNVPLKRLDKIIELIGKNKDITIVELSRLLEVTDKTIKRDIKKLKDTDKLTRVGSLKSGYWEVKE